MHRPGERTVCPSLARVRLAGRTWAGESWECWPHVPKPIPLVHPTWVLAAPTPLDETDDEQDQHQEGDGTHEPNEPALGGNVCLVVGVSWGGAGAKT